MTLLAQLFFWCFFWGKKLSQYDDIEPVPCPELVRCHWASTMTLSQYDDTDSTVRPTFLVGPSEMKENDSFYHPQNSPWQRSFWFLSSDYIRTLENWASKEIWDGTQNEVDWVQKDSIFVPRSDLPWFLSTRKWAQTLLHSRQCHITLVVVAQNCGTKISGRQKVGLYLVLIGPVLVASNNSGRHSQPQIHMNPYA